MMTLEQIRERNRKENAAARRLQAAGYRLEGWDPRTGQRIAARITSENTNAERRTFYSFPTWQDAPPHYPGSRREIIPNINPRTKENTP